MGLERGAEPAAEAGEAAVAPDSVCMRASLKGAGESTHCTALAPLAHLPMDTVLRPMMTCSLD